MLKKPIILVLFSALILRLIIAPFFEHGDVIQYYYWAMDLWNNGFPGFYDRNIANAMRPTYPPVTSYLFWMSALLHESTWLIFWFLNNTIPAFPSNMVFWLESERGWYFFNKLPAIIADILLIGLVYKFSQNLKPKKLILLPSIFFAFLPPFWYSSSVWGQTDSIYALFMLYAFYLLHKNEEPRPASRDMVSSHTSLREENRSIHPRLNNVSWSSASYDKLLVASIFYCLAILTKPTCFFALPIFLFWWFKRARIKTVVYSLLINFIVVVTLYFPFHPQDLLRWIITFYKHSLGGELPYITANAFNFWALVFGFRNVPGETIFLGLPAYIFGYGLFLCVLALNIGYLYLKREKIDSKILLIIASFTSFAAFMFLPGMHERYFYPVLILLLPLVGLDKKIRLIFLALSMIHLINLYHFFWVPKVDFLVNLLSNAFIERAIIILNFVLFCFLGKQVFSSHATRKLLK